MPDRVAVQTNRVSAIPPTGAGRPFSMRALRNRVSGLAVAAVLPVTLIGCSTAGPVLTGQPTPPTVATTPQRPSAPQRSGAPQRPSATATGPKILLDDDFTGSSLDGGVWSTCYWWDDHGCTISSNNELEWYRPEAVSLSGGALQLTAEPSSERGPDGTKYPFRSGMVSTGPPKDGEPAKLAFTYGTVEARLRVPAGTGLWSAMWLLPASQESRPEVDVLEILGNDPTTTLMHLHPQNRDAESPSKALSPRGTDFSTGWHDFRLEWTPRSLTYYVDGKASWTVRGGKVPHEPMYLILNLAVGGEYPGSPSRTTRFPATLAVDQVRITAPAS